MLNVRQVSLIIFMYTAVSKTLLYPTQLSGISGRDLLFSAGVDFLIQGAVVWATAYLISRTDKTFFRMLADRFGEVAARVIFGFFAAFFLFVTIYPLFEQKSYVHTVFYDNMPMLPLFLPVFFFLVYAGSKNFKNIGRCADICLPIFLVSAAFLLATGVGEADFSNLLPVLKTPVSKVFSGALATSYRFIEPCWLLMFAGNVQKSRHTAAKITLSYVAAAAIVLFFLAVFYGVYANLAPSRHFAVSKISLYFSAIDVIGRVDLSALYALEIVMLFALVLNIQLAVYCLSLCTGFKDAACLSLAASAVLAIILIALNNGFGAIEKFFSSWAWIAVVLFAVAAPLSAWAIRGKNDT